jgi:hypothetical protein
VLDICATAHKIGTFTRREHQEEIFVAHPEHGGRFFAGPSGRPARSIATSAPCWTVSARGLWGAARRPVGTDDVSRRSRAEGGKSASVPQNYRLILQDNRWL